ncbi:hypothetical protein R3P93_22425 [Rhodococcus cerastii]|uniref:DUF8176 domain-containing protein n=1 Tax=Rhodococcus cerastii TaxID=908616 RepID=A0ABU4D6J6_9NOCA|nr:hypothetical protein [Rhodococcus cerastii]MDV6305330.1 hypothetical protein [Rhodococcus cerastii]
MAPRETPDDSSDDWFADPIVADTETVAAASERRLTVLTDQNHTDDHDDDWFAGDSANDMGSARPADGYSSFDERTSLLRTGGPYTAQTPPPRSWWRRHRSTVAVTTALTVLVGGGLGAALVLTGVDDEPQAPAALLPDEILTTTTVPTSAAPAAAGAAAADVTWCRGQADGEPVTEDSDDPGAVAIWRFEKAFYFDRDGAAARAAGAPDAVMASAQRLQQGIDQLEPDIEFCVLADPIDAGIYDVTVVERGPGIDGRMSRQRITTTKAQDGATLISAIVPR